MKTLAAILILLSAPNVLPAQDVDFGREVQPIFRSTCYKCHGYGKQKGKLRLDSPEAIMKGGDNGPVIVPGKPSESTLYKRITLPADNDDIMPNGKNGAFSNPTDTAARGDNCVVQFCKGEEHFVIR